MSIRFTKQKLENFTAYGLGTHKVCVAVRDNKEVLCLVGEEHKPYRPLGGRKTLLEIIDTCEEGVTYIWKPLTELTTY
tara:strand:- start:278 stop:511 length:234 start_codon:yes stop_codon:yes gene_type:complete